MKDIMKAHPDLEQSILWQIPVPQECINKTFEELFLYLLKKKLICMALYRLKHAQDNIYPYVYTNPDPETIVGHRDRAFVLGIEISDDLQGDKYEMLEKEQEVELGQVKHNRYPAYQKAHLSRGGAGNRGPESRKGVQPKTAAVRDDGQANRRGG